MNRPGEPRDCEHGLWAAAYVLAALEPDEVECCQAHLGECATCREEVAILQPVVDLLAEAAPRTRAPVALRERVMAQVQAEAELFKAAGPDMDRAPPGRWWTSRQITALGLSGAAAAAVAVAALDSGTGTPAPRPRPRTVPAIVSTGAPGARAKLLLTGQRAELIVSGLPQPPLSQTYEVWLSRAGQAPQPTDALFSVNRTGGGSIDVPGNLRGVVHLIVTTEPIGGSLHPTTPPIITASL